jgi:hypothetical protein
MKKNAILFSRVDREDYWVSSGISFKVKYLETYEEAYEEVKEQLESPEMIEYIIDDCCLLNDLFHFDETFKFYRTYWSMGLVFEFINTDGHIVEHRYSCDFIFIGE